MKKEQLTTKTARPFERTLSFRLARCRFFFFFSVFIHTLLALSDSDLIRHRCSGPSSRHFDAIEAAAAHAELWEIC
jgi:hypothetical protein